MAQQLQRTQILLEPEQHKALGEIARQHGRSLSDVVREIVQVYLHEQATDEETRRALDALQKLAGLREEARRRYGVYQGDLIAEAREEREVQLDSVLTGEAQP